MIKVQVRPNEPLEAALRRFKRQCNYAGVFRLAKKHSVHEKSSDKRRREDRERIRNIQRAMRKQKGVVRKTKRRKARFKTRSSEGEGEGLDGEEQSLTMPAAPRRVVDRAVITQVVASQVANDS